MHFTLLILNFPSLPAAGIIHSKWELPINNGKSIFLNTIEWTLFIGSGICAFIATGTLCLGFLFSACHEHKIAAKLFKFGWVCSILMIFLFGFLAITFEKYLAGILILASVSSGLMLRKSEINQCPSCDQFISPEKRWSYFTKWMFLRNNSCCPNCGISLTLAKWPWRMMQIGLVLVIAYMFLYLLNVLPDSALRTLVLIPVSLLLLGTLTCRFVPMNTD